MKDIYRKDNKLNTLFEDKPDAKDEASVSAMPTGGDTKKDSEKGKKKK